MINSYCHSNKKFFQQKTEVSLPEIRAGFMFYAIQSGIHLSKDFLEKEVDITTWNTFK